MRICDNPITTEGRKRGWEGYCAMIPWNEDPLVYSNRTLQHITYKTFHEGKNVCQLLARAYLTTYFWQWSAIPMKQCEKTEGEAIKYLHVSLAWIFTQPLMSNFPEGIWADLVQDSTRSIEGFSVKEATTPVVEPTSAVMFLNSAINISGTWSDMSCRLLP